MKNLANARKYCARPRTADAPKFLALRRHIANRTLAGEILEAAMSRILAWRIRRDLLIAARRRRRE